MNSPIFSYIVCVSQNSMISKDDVNTLISELDIQDFVSFWKKLQIIDYWIFI